MIPNLILHQEEKPPTTPIATTTTITNRAKVEHSTPSSSLIDYTKTRPLLPKQASLPHITIHHDDLPNKSSSRQQRQKRPSSRHSKIMDFKMKMSTSLSSIVTFHDDDDAGENPSNEQAQEDHNNCNSNPSPSNFGTPKQTTISNHHSVPRLSSSAFYNIDRDHDINAGKLCVKPIMESSLRPPPSVTPHLSIPTKKHQDHNNDDEDHLMSDISMSMNDTRTKSRMNNHYSLISPSHKQKVSNMNTMIKPSSPFDREPTNVNDDNDDQHHHSFVSDLSISINCMRARSSRWSNYSLLSPHQHKLPTTTNTSRIMPLSSSFLQEHENQKVPTHDGNDDINHVGDNDNIDDENHHSILSDLSISINGMRTRTSSGRMNPNSNHSSSDKKRISGGKNSRYADDSHTTQTTAMLTNSSRSSNSLTTLLQQSLNVTNITSKDLLVSSSHHRHRRFHRSMPITHHDPVNHNSLDLSNGSHHHHDRNILRHHDSFRSLPAVTQTSTTDDQGIKTPQRRISSRQELLLRKCHSMRSLSKSNRNTALSSSSFHAPSSWHRSSSCMLRDDKDDDGMTAKYDNHHDGEDQSDNLLLLLGNKARSNHLPPSAGAGNKNKNNHIENDEREILPLGDEATSSWIRIISPQKRNIDDSNHHHSAPNSSRHSTVHFSTAHHSLCFMDQQERMIRQMYVDLQNAMNHDRSSSSSSTSLLDASAATMISPTTNAASSSSLSDIIVATKELPDISLLPLDEENKKDKKAADHDMMESHTQSNNHHKNMESIIPTIPTTKQQQPLLLSSSPQQDTQLPKTPQQEQQRKKCHDMILLMLSPSSSPSYLPYHHKNNQESDKNDFSHYMYFE